MALFVFCLLAFHCLDTQAQNNIDYETNMFRSGDILQKELLSGVVSGEGGYGVTWDFQDVKTLKPRYSVEYYCDSDSAFLEIEPNFMCLYRLRNDSLIQTGYQNAITKMEYTTAPLILKYPFAYGDSVSSVIEGKGMYCGKNAMEVHGSVYTVADGLGTLILSPADTLNNVLRLHLLRMSSVSMAKDTVMDDSCATSLEIDDRYQWFARGYRYPVLEARSISYYHNADFIKCRQCALRYNPGCQRQLCDTINENIAKEDSVNRSTCNEQIFSYTVETTGNVVHVNYSVKTKADIIALIANTQGMLFRCVHRTDEAGNNYSMTIDCNGLKHGEYILYINVNGEIYTHKIAVK